ncbi:hypothetical protein CJF30_00008312 [Rutstroemia sp. NJR-2017a BBW]|nr:hypothetical protein CJF30_00008312 [Rutstroemia sp. NJR-2017a BBW]
MVLKGEPGWICLMCCNVDIRLLHTLTNSLHSPLQRPCTPLDNIQRQRLNLLTQQLLRQQLSTRAQHVHLTQKIRTSLTSFRDRAEGVYIIHSRQLPSRTTGDSHDDGNCGD